MHRNMARVDFDNLFDEFAKMKIAVLGDVMLDTYWWGRVDRISPEAPVPVVALERKEYRMGGAGNVALNLACLGANVSVLSVIGDDEEGAAVTRLFEDNRVQTGALLKSGTRITTSKSRIISRNQQMMRLDAEITDDLSAEDEDRLLLRVEQYIEANRPQALILEDYNKGVLTENVIGRVIAICRRYGVITSVDPKRKHFLSYKNVDIFKPNLKEAKEGLNLIEEKTSLELLNRIHDQLHGKLGHAVSFITLSEKGVFYREHQNGRIIPSHLRNIADVSGAGDTVIAVASLVYASTGNVRLMAEMANIAGGLVCEEVGTVAINRHRLLEECKLLLSGNDN